MLVEEGRVDGRSGCGEGEAESAGPGHILVVSVLVLGES